MSCASCTRNEIGTPKGCKNNGTCGTDSCNKLTVFDWLGNMQPLKSVRTLNTVEVRFKNGRKKFYTLPDRVKVVVGDPVITEVENGYDLGLVSLTGDLVIFQMKKKKIELESDQVSKILRKASQQEIDIWHSLRNKESQIQKRARELAIALGLQMKISDVEYQADGKKATFYYTADSRVDFRQLIKDMAKTFSTRIEMRQIGLREEASRLGGIGSCGRELCCSTWLTDYRTVSTSSARYQQLSLNPIKLSGQCGKLKCCLNYELEAYRAALKNFPKSGVKLETEKGIGIFQKMDIFKEYLWYSYKGEWMNWHKLSLSSVLAIIKKNDNNEKVSSLEEYIDNSKSLSDKKLEPNFENDIGQDSLTRFDLMQKMKNKRRKKRNQNKP
tara:strand:+ start:507 stop:1661 length:1155 start_codon:yes stop_codon:yes gene_type:complete